MAMVIVKDALDAAIIQGIDFMRLTSRPANHIPTYLTVDCVHLIRAIQHPTNAHARMTPAPFATAAGVCVFLSVLGDPGWGIVYEEKVIARIEGLEDAVHIAVRLNARSFVTRLIDRLEKQSSVGLRYALGQAFDIDTTEREYHPLYRAKQYLWHPPDLSFPLDYKPEPMIGRLLEAFAAPHCLERWRRYSDRLVKAIAYVTIWWTTGITFGAYLLDGVPDEDHTSRCINHPIALQKILAKTAPIALVALAESKTRSQRREKIEGIIEQTARGCEGCRKQVEEVYLSGLRYFNARFPELL